jgi:hypothetical protein
LLIRRRGVVKGGKNVIGKVKLSEETSYPNKPFQLPIHPGYSKNKYCITYGTGIPFPSLSMISAKSSQ